MRRNTALIVGILAILALVAVVFIVLFFLSERAGGYQRLYDVPGIEVPFDFKWDEVNGLVISAILKSSGVKTDNNGEYVDLLLPENQTKGSPTNIRVYFDKDEAAPYQAVSVLFLIGGRYTEQQKWIIYTLDELSPKLKKDAQVVLYSRVDKDRYSRLSKSFIGHDELQITNVTNIVIRE